MLREESDLDALSNAFAVGETMQPAHVSSLWLRASRRAVEDTEDK